LTVSTLFSTVNLPRFDALMTQRALIAYSVGLIGLIVAKVVAPGFFIPARTLKRGKESDCHRLR